MFLHLLTIQLFYKTNTSSEFYETKILLQLFYKTNILQFFIKTNKFFYNCHLKQTDKWCLIKLYQKFNFRKLIYIKWNLIKLQQKFNFRENSVELFAEPITSRGSCAMAQAESLRFKLLGGLAVRRACYSVLNFVMNSGEAKGCEVIVSGKLRAQRAKVMKFRDGKLFFSTIL